MKEKKTPKLKADKKSVMKKETRRTAQDKKRTER
jgi:hypothetical protein